MKLDKTLKVEILVAIIFTSGLWTTSQTMKSRYTTIRMKFIQKF